MGICFPYLGEFQPTKYRERILCWMEMFWTIGVIVLPCKIPYNLINFVSRGKIIGKTTTICSFFSSSFISVIAWLVIPLDFKYQVDNFQFKSWNLFVALCALPSLILGLWLFTFPESPKFLLEYGETDLAMEVFKYIYATNTGNDPDTYPVSCF